MGWLQITDQPSSRSGSHCRGCLRDSVAPDPTARMSTSIRLRPWQNEALARWTTIDRPDFLAVATPGAGKTTFALTAARQDLAAHPGRTLVVVAPTQHLKGQWAAAAERFGLHLDPAWISGEPLPAEVHGIVTTYQQVASSSRELAKLAEESNWGKETV